MASSSSALCARRASLATKSNYTPFTPPAFTASVCRGATQTRSRYRAYATVNKPPKVLYDVWGQIPEPPPGMFARWFDATRQAQERDKGAKWLRYSDEEYLNAVEMFRQAAPKFGSDWVLKLKKELRPDAALLNDLGSVIARYSPQVDNLNGQSLPVPTVIQWAMFSGAAHLGCEISTMSMARWIAIASYQTNSISKRPLFRPIMDLHKKYLDEGKPMALFVEGEFLMRTRKIDAAIRFLTRAFKQSNSTALWWSDICNALGTAHKANNEDQIAMKYWEEAARAGNLDALKAISRIAAEEEKRDDAMYKLACRGDVESLNELAMVESRKFLEDNSATRAAKQFQEKWALEWRKLAEYDQQTRGVRYAAFDPRGPASDPGGEGHPLTEEQRSELERMMKELEERPQDPKDESKK